MCVDGGVAGETPVTMVATCQSQGCHTPEWTVILLPIKLLMGPSFTKRSIMLIETMNSLRKCHV